MGSQPRRKAMIASLTRSAGLAQGWRVEVELVEADDLDVGADGAELVDELRRVADDHQSGPVGADQTGRGRRGGFGRDRLHPGHEAGDFRGGEALLEEIGEDSAQAATGFRLTVEGAGDEGGRSEERRVGKEG